MATSTYYVLVLDLKNLFAGKPTALAESPLVPQERSRQEVALWLRHWIVRSTTQAGTGHLTSSLSAVELMTELFVGGFFHYDLSDPKNPANDRLLFSKGHASPLFYALWAAVGGIAAEELLTLRQISSRLEGHPTMAFPFTEAPTGSLGQGLAIGAGMALHWRRAGNTTSHMFVLLGDGEMAEGSNWEALQLAARYKLNNLIGIVDVSGLEQVGETMYARDRDDNGAMVLEKRISAFGWHTIMVDGHNCEQLRLAYEQASKTSDMPTMIIAVTTKGKGVSLVAGKSDWHGKVLSKDQETVVLQELGRVAPSMQIPLPLPMPVAAQTRFTDQTYQTPKYTLGQMVSVRQAYGDALLSLTKAQQNVVALDAGMSNSTMSDSVSRENLGSFYEMYIAEQNMVGMAEGMALRGDIPFASTFAAFYSRAFDQLRMAAYAQANCKFVGSHAGCSIGQDGASQMGLEDIALFRSIYNCTVLYPSDATSMGKIVGVAAEHVGMVYIRSTRATVPVLYPPEEEFKIGGCKVLRKSDHDRLTIVAAGITVHEALKAYAELAKESVFVRVIDAYSIVPLDTTTIAEAMRETGAVLVVEDHYPAGGIGEAVRSALTSCTGELRSLAVTHMPHSGSPEDLLRLESIDSAGIVAAAKAMLQV